MSTQTTKRTRISLTLNGFHGYQTRNVLATIGPKNPAGEPWDYHNYGAGLYPVEIDESEAEKFSCKCADCTCGESMPTTFYMDQWDVDHKKVTIRGNYPQHS